MPIMRNIKNFTFGNKITKDTFEHFGATVEMFESNKKEMEKAKDWTKVGVDFAVGKAKNLEDAEKPGLFKKGKCQRIIIDYDPEYEFYLIRNMDMTYGLGEKQEDIDRAIKELSEYVEILRQNS